MIMKKMIMILALAITLGTSVFAREEKVSPQVLNAFKTEFVTAQEVNWTVHSSYYQAAFTLNSQRVFAYYSIEGELLGLTRYISSLQLPINLQNGIKKNYADYWITDLFEMAKNEGTSYYLTLEDANTKIILKSNNGTDWFVHKKSKKS